MSSLSKTLLPNDLPAPALLSIRQVCALISFRPAYVYRLVQEGRFPKPIKIGKRATRWPVATVYDWIAEQIESAA